MLLLRLSGFAQNAVRGQVLPATPVRCPVVGTVSTCKLSINVVKTNDPKDADRLEPKGNRVGKRTTFGLEAEV